MRVDWVATAFSPGQVVLRGLWSPPTGGGFEKKRYNNKGVDHEIRPLR